MTFLLIALTRVPVAAAKPVTPPVPVRSSSPGTDLGHYPKLPVITTGPSARTDTQADAGVVALTNRPDGGADITTYTPALGITDQQLYGLLKAQGVRGLLNPATTSNTSVTKKIVGAAPSAAAAAAACRIGSAHTNGCPGVHWANNGFGHPQVYFVDHTSAAWPVDVSVYKWNQAQGVDSIYAAGRCPGYSGTHCAHLYNANYGATGWAGQTYTPVDAHLNILDGKVTSKFNDYYGTRYTAAQRRQDTCHEEGHVLGLAHNDATNSCLYFAILRSGAPPYPDSDDFALLKSVYSYQH